ncbi:hypothetical protein ACFOU2_15990 [Bacillus songklensis]|uniref:Uncharacterized protein n=1 Tax=Bacillus songklensis TaxID=1069116 RepID=A0ABV8B4T2_9BACI
MLELQRRSRSLTPQEEANQPYGLACEAGQKRKAEQARLNR